MQELQTQMQRQPRVGRLQWLRSQRSDCVCLHRLLRCCGSFRYRRLQLPQWPNPVVAAAVPFLIFFQPNIFYTIYYSAYGSFFPEELPTLAKVGDLRSRN
jgi:hypothetical protein